MPLTKIRTRTSQTKPETARSARVSLRELSQISSSVLRCAGRIVVSSGGGREYAIGICGTNVRHSVAVTVERYPANWRSVGRAHETDCFAVAGPLIK